MDGLGGGLQGRESWEAEISDIVGCEIVGVRIGL